MAKADLSTGERTFVIHGIQDGLRTDGRTCENYRNIDVECGVVSNTSGSARLRLANTQVLVGIKAEMGTPRPTRPNEGYVEFFVDFSANASPEFEGRGGEELAVEISNILSTVYDHQQVLDYRSLSIISRQCCWVVYVDVVVLECGGNLFDAIGMAVKAALYNTRLPHVTVQTDDDGQEEIEVSDDPHDVIALNTDNIPLLVTVSKVGQRHVVDASLEEEACCVACLVVAVSKGGNICGMEKKGPNSLALESIQDMINTAKKVGILLNQSLSTVLQEVGYGVKAVGFLY